MYITAKTLDDLMRSVLERLLVSRNVIRPSKGPATELTGVLLKLTDPRTRLSRTERKGTVFSCLGEFLWYLAGSKDLKFIEYYLPRYREFSDDKKTVHGAYGPRLFGGGHKNQVHNVIKLLKEKPDSRQAVIQLFDSADIAKVYKDVPCTCTLQFLIRRNKLHLIASMRSNDAFVGLPHDIFAFTLLQEIVARSVGVELGQYKHAVGSLHLYEPDRDGAQQFIDEGFQTVVPMQPMPYGDPWIHIEKLLQAEHILRRGKEFDLKSNPLPPFWADLVRVLQIFHFFKNKVDTRRINQLAKEMSSDVFVPYIKRRHAKAIAKEQKPTQREMFDELSDENSSA